MYLDASTPPHSNYSITNGRNQAQSRCIYGRMLRACIGMRCRFKSDVFTSPNIPYMDLGWKNEILAKYISDNRLFYFNLGRSGFLSKMFLVCKLNDLLILTLEHELNIIRWKQFVITWYVRQKEIPLDSAHAATKIAIAAKQTRLRLIFPTAVQSFCHLPSTYSIFTSFLSRRYKMLYWYAIWYIYIECARSHQSKTINLLFMRCISPHFNRPIIGFLTPTEAINSMREIW